MTILLKWLGHAAFQIRIDGKIIYVDLYETAPTEKADLILVSHSHSDHCDPFTIKSVRKDKTIVIAPADCAIKLDGEVKSLTPGQETTLENIRIRAVEAYNVKRFRSPGIPFHPKGLGVGYLIIAEGKTIYHAGDTDFIPEMKQLGNVDIALVPSGGTYTMDNSDAAEAILSIKPDVAIPMHRWNTDPNEIKKLVDVKSKIRVHVVSPGEEYQVT